MILKVSWTEIAVTQFRVILDYWDERNKSNIYSKKLIDLVDQSILRLQTHPEIGKKTNNPRIRIKIISNYFLYYTFSDNELNVLGIADMRRNPKYLKTLLK